MMDSPTPAGPEPPPPAAATGAAAPPLPEAPQAPGAPQAPVPLPFRVAILAGFVLTVGLGVARIDDRVRGLDDFRVDLSRTRLSRAPAWLPDGERKALLEGAAGSGNPSIYDEGLPEAVAGRAGADPRVARVLGSRRRHPDAVEVVLELRRPVALVEAGGRTAAVDREGIHVPGDYGKAGLPRIRGGGGEFPAPGKPFGRAVAEGASVAAAVPRDLADPLGLAVVDVSGVEKGEGVVLRRAAAKGTAGVAVEWGRAPSSPGADLDPPVPGKIARLRLAAERFPGLAGLRTVRLCFDELVVVPL